eukprot:595314-Rhodomonas_salina.1
MAKRTKPPFLRAGVNAHTVPLPLPELDSCVHSAQCVHPWGIREYPTRVPGYPGTRVPGYRPDEHRVSGPESPHLYPRAQRPHTASLRDHQGDPENGKIVTRLDPKVTSVRKPAAWLHRDRVSPGVPGYPCQPVGIFSASTTTTTTRGRGWHAFSAPHVGA